MRGNRSIIVGLLALVAAVGMLGANGYFWWLAQSGDDTPASTPSRNAAPQWPAANDRQLTSPADDDEHWYSSYRDLHHESTPENDHETEPARRFFPHQAEAMEISQADGSEDPVVAPDNPPALASPPPLLLPEDAEPLEQTPAADWLPRLIQQELPKASAEEIRIWSQELKGFEPEVVQDLLRMRKSVTAGTPARPRAKPDSAPTWPDFPEPDLPADHGLVPDPLEELPAEAHSVANRLGPSLVAFEQARDVILNNLANTHTIGFKRSRVMLAAASPDPSLPLSENNLSIGWGVELSATPLDTTDGPLKKTDQPWDVAIAGPGFFQINGGEEVLYTRCGMWTKNADGQLCLMSGDKLRPVEPSLTVPADALGVTISETGVVTALSSGDDMQVTVIGKIVLARFPNPSGLKPRGGHLLAATSACGTPRAGSPQSQGFGLVRQGMLELSNVSRDEELEQFQMLQSQLQLLKHLANSADAYSPPGPVARKPSNQTQRASAYTEPLNPPPSLEPLKALKNKGRDLIEKYLHSEETKRSQRSDRNPEEWYDRFIMSERARAIERNLGFD